MAKVWLVSQSAVDNLRQYRIEELILVILTGYGHLSGIRFSIGSMLRSLVLALFFSNQEKLGYGIAIVCFTAMESVIWKYDMMRYDINQLSHVYLHWMNLLLSCYPALTKMRPGDRMFLASVISEALVYGTSRINLKGGFKTLLSASTDSIAWIICHLMCFSMILTFALQRQQAPPLLFAVTFALGVLGGSLAIVLIQIGKNTVFDIAKKSLLWIGIEVALIVGVALLAHFARKHNLLPLTIIRKFFHGLSLAVFIPGLILHEPLLIILFGVMAFLMIGLEMVRLISIKFDLKWRYRELLNEFLTGFDDGKDKDLVITHICLLVGCLWPAVSFNMTRFQMDVTLKHDLLDPKQLEHLWKYCGLIFIGIADSFASILGRSLGRFKVGNKTLEGTAAFIITSLLSNKLLGSGQAGPVEFAMFTFIGIIELLSGLIDNLALPLLAVRMLCATMRPPFKN